MTLLDEISEMRNIEAALNLCLKGKRSALGAQKVFLNKDFALSILAENLRKGHLYPWGAYRSFFVSDPKRRLIHAAPFIDRVAHAAIYRVVEPILSANMLPCAFACRRGLGNSHAVVRLMSILRNHPHPYVVKLDVKQFFASISHRRLMGKLRSALPDMSLDSLFRGLLQSHPLMTGSVGLPLGNLTSQIFANFYLNDLDHFIVRHLGGNYLRYMDDLVLITADRHEARCIVPEVVRFGKQEKLKFPVKKRVWLGECSEVPFLGFQVSPLEARPLRRNSIRFARRLCHFRTSGRSLSLAARSLESYESWRDFPVMKSQQASGTPQLI